MKKIVLTVLLTILSVSTQFAQKVEEEKVISETDFNHWSIDVNGGITKPITPFTPGYFVNIVSLFHTDLGARYMFNNKFGLKADFGYDRLENGNNSLPFQTQYYRTSIQGVANLGRLFNFEEWTRLFNLQAHLGAGYSFMKNDNFLNVDHMANLIVGLTGQIKLSNRVALNGDFSLVNNIKQSYTFDGRVSSDLNKNGGFNGNVYNASLGLSIYLGKKEEHADWYYETKLADEIIALENRISELEIMNNDSDKDGVVDYLDVEPNTITGVKVDTKGRSVDTNRNGIPDELESYLNTTYGEGSNTAIKNQNTIKELIDGGYVSIYFDTNSIKPFPSSVSNINYLVQYLRSNPNATADLIGYADEVGNVEYNNILSAKRAESIKQILVDAGIKASRLNVIGNGEDTSVNKNSKVARGIVRRVTFKIKN